MLSKDAKIIVNNQEIPPISLNFDGKVKYPKNGFELIKKGYENAELIEGIALAERAGDSRTVNLVLLGRLSNYLLLEQSVWEGVIKRFVPPSTVERNIHAFRIGKRLK